MTPKEFKDSSEYKEWKKSIVRRRLEKLDQLLSSGEWISNSRMIEEVNELYLEAPNDDCYYSSVPHRIILSKEESKKEYESQLYLAYALTVRQDRFAINKILKMVGKDHIWERKDNGDGTEGSYRYKTKYSIFEKYTVNDIQFDDYELANSVPVVLNTIHEGLKTGEADPYLEEVTRNIKDLDFATTQSITLLTTLAKALKQAQAINNNLVSTLLDKVFNLYDAQKEGWEKAILKNTINAYYAASHPDAVFDKKLLFYIRLLIIITKIVDGADADILEYLKKEYEELNNPEVASEYPDVEEFIVAAIKYYVFEFCDYDGMALVLEEHYKECLEANKIIEDYGLMIAIHAFIYPEEWQYDEDMHESLDNLIALYNRIEEKDDYVRWMLLLFICLKQYIEAAKNGPRASSFSEWSRLKFELISSFPPDSIAELVYNKAPDDDLHAMLHIGDLADQGKFVEYMILTDMRFDLKDVLNSLVDGNENYQEYLSAEEAQHMYEELLQRFTKLDGIFAVAENSALLNCRLSLALLHDSLSHKKEALEYYTSVREMYNKGDVEVTEHLYNLVSNRIDFL
jgi:hypothetical protein